MMKNSLYLFKGMSKEVFIEKWINIEEINIVPFMYRVCSDNFYKLDNHVSYCKYKSILTQIQFLDLVSKIFYNRKLGDDNGSDKS